MLKKQYDVLICGGGLAGLTLARHLRMSMPDLSLAVVEKTKRPLPEAGFKVGESSIEGGSNFIGKTLGLHDYLKDKHFLKNGLRFFPGSADKSMDARPEMGPPCAPLLPSYQMDRGVLENDLRKMVEDAAIDLLEGYNLREFELCSNSSHKVRVENLDSHESTELNCRWLVDAGGRRFLIQSKLNLRNQWEHNLDATWFRVKGRLDINDFVEKGEWQSKRDPQNMRYFSTNHLMGDGYWVWLIPLGSGFTSVGIVAPEEHHPIKERSSYPLALKWLEQHEPVVARHLEGLEPLDFKCFKNCSYGSEQTFSVDRWACVGEAGVFVDPLYSYGLDFIAMSNLITAEMIARDFKNQLTPKDVDEFNNFYLSLANNVVQLFNGSYHIFNHSHVMLGKLYWDTGYYWGFFAPLSFFRLYRQPELLSQNTSLKNTLALNLRMQQLFKEWARIASSAQAPGYTNYPALYSYLARAHVELAKDKSPQRALRDIEKNCRILEDVARVWFRRAVKDALPDKVATIEAKGAINPYAISLDPSRWEADGLFDAAPCNTAIIEKDISFYCSETHSSTPAKLLHFLKLSAWNWAMKPSTYDAPETVQGYAFSR